MANLSWLNFLAPGVGSVIDYAVNSDKTGTSTEDNIKAAAQSFLDGFINPFGNGVDGSSNPIMSFLTNSGKSFSGSLSDFGDSLGKGLGNGLGNGLSSFVDGLINGSLGDILRQGSGDPDYTAAQAIGDLFTGGAVSANKETRLNNAWQRQFSEEQRDYERAFAEEEQAYNRAFAENERDYQRNTIDSFNMGIQNANLDLQKQSLAHQISMDEFNKDLALHGTSLAAQDAASVGINPLAMSGNVSPFSSSVGSAGSSSGLASQGASPTSARPGSASSPALGQLATFAPMQQAISAFLGLSQSQERLSIDKSASEASIANQKGFLANETYDKQTQRLKTLIDAKKAGFKVSDDKMYDLISEDWNNSYHNQLRSFIRNTNADTNTKYDRSFLERDNYDMLNSYHEVLKDLVREQIKTEKHNRGMKVWENTNQSVGKLFDLVGDVLGGLRRF